MQAPSKNNTDPFHSLPSISHASCAVWSRPITESSRRSRSQSGSCPSTKPAISTCLFVIAGPVLSHGLRKDFTIQVRCSYKLLNLNPQVSWELDGRFPSASQPQQPQQQQQQQHQHTPLPNPKLAATKRRSGSEVCGTPLHPCHASHFPLVLEKAYSRPETPSPRSRIPGPQPCWLYAGNGGMDP